MCRCGTMNISRDFLSLMRVVTHKSMHEGIDDFEKNLPDDCHVLKLSQCTVDSWVITTGMIVHQVTGITNNRFICQDAQGVVQLTQQACNYVADALRLQARGEDVGLNEPPLAAKEGRIHQSHDGYMHRGH